MPTSFDGLQLEAKYLFSASNVHTDIPNFLWGLNDSE